MSQLLYPVLFIGSECPLAFHIHQNLTVSSYGRQPLPDHGSVHELSDLPGQCVGSEFDNGQHIHD